VYEDAGPASTGMRAAAEYDDIFDDEAEQPFSEREEWNDDEDVDLVGDNAQAQVQEEHGSLELECANAKQLEVALARIARLEDDVACLTAKLPAESIAKNEAPLKLEKTVAEQSTARLDVRDDEGNATSDDAIRRTEVFAPSCATEERPADAEEEHGRSNVDVDAALHDYGAQVHEFDEKMAPRQTSTCENASRSVTRKKKAKKSRRSLTT
jgi:hypothetical protein